MQGSKSPSIVKTCLSLKREGRIKEALAQLRDALRRGKLSPDEIQASGRFLSKALPGSSHAASPIKVLVVGQCTTSWLVQVLIAEAWGHGAAIVVQEGEYDSVLQELSALGRGDGRPDVVVIVGWGQRLLAAGKRSFQERIDDECQVMAHAWNLVQSSGARLVQVGFDWTLPGALGYQLGGRRDGDVRLVRAANQALRDSLPDTAYFVDLEQVSAMLGHDTFYDARNYYWTKHPFSARGVWELGRHVWAGIRALTVGPKKLLILDLDNTLWGGVVGELGPLGIQLGDSPEGEAFRTFQAHVKAMTKRGVVLAVCSKNNAQDAREPFEKNPDMVLSLEDFACFDASWDPKPVVIERIAKELRLGLDSCVFFDDNPAEREHVLQMLPDVDVADVPEDPADYIHALQQGLWFEAALLTEADQDRVQQYAEEAQRRQVEQSADSLDDYLRSLETTADIRDVTDTDMQRVAQLLAKTNQFNVTTRRHSREDVVAMMAQERSLGLTLRASDRFGDHGLVAILIGVPDDAGVMTIDTWLMSCRVIGRTIEQFFIGEFMRRARRLGYTKLRGEYIATKKNSLVSSLYDDVGFVQADVSPERNVYELDLSAGCEPVTFVTSIVETPEQASPPDQDSNG